jgi:flagellar biosynthesis/type III secretory pathway protein FliH
MSLDEAKKLRKEANTLRARLKAYDDAKAEAEAAQLSETERLKKQVDDLQKKHDDALKAVQETRLSAEIRLQAQALGIAPDLAEKLIDRSDVLDTDGNPQNVDAALKVLLKTYPMLAGKPPAPTGGGATNPSKAQSSVPVALTRESIAEMASKRPDEYTARRAEIQAWLAAHPWRYGQP